MNNSFARLTRSVSILIAGLAIESGFAFGNPDGSIKDLDAKNGFRELSFGQPLPKDGTFKIWKPEVGSPDPRITTAYRIQETKTLAEMPLKIQDGAPLVEYSFFDDAFFKVSLSFEVGYDPMVNYKILCDYLSSRYGSPKETPRATLSVTNPTTGAPEYEQSAQWEGQKVRLKVKIHSMFGLSLEMENIAIGAKATQYFEEHQKALRKQTFDNMKDGL